VDVRSVYVAEHRGGSGCDEVDASFIKGIAGMNTRRWCEGTARGEKGEEKRRTRSGVAVVTSNASVQMSRNLTH